MTAPASPLLLTLILTGIATSLSAWQASRWLTSQLPLSCEREELDVTGRVLDLVKTYEGPGGTLHRLDLRVHTLSPARCHGPGRVRLYLHEDARDVHTAVPRIADRMHATVRLRRPWGLVNPAAADGERRYLLQGIHAVGSVKRYRLVADPGRLDLWESLGRLRARISKRIRTRVGGETGGLLAALAVGDRRYIDGESWDRLRTFGLTHLLVISGMHVTLLAAPAWWLGARLVAPLSRLGVPGRLLKPVPVLAALGVAGGYSVLAGLSLPTQRALLMLTLAVCPWLLDRPVDRPRLLACCAFGLLVLDPVSVIGSSYWLSLGAVGFLLWSTGWETPGQGSALQTLLRAQLLMLGAMLPLGLFWFQSAGTFGGLLNLIAIPLITLWVVPLLLLSQLLHLLDPGLGNGLLDLSALPLATLWHAMGFWEGRIAHLGVVRASPGLPALACAVIAVGLVALPGFRLRTPLVLMLFLPVLLPVGPISESSLLVRFYDVGQGTAVLLRQGKHTLLYDTGGGPPGGVPVAERSLLPSMAAEGIRSLDLLVVSHADADHAAGEASVRGSLEVREVLRGRVGQRDGRACRLGERRRLGEALELQFLSTARPGDSDNNSSCVVLAHAFGRRIVLAGDIDARRERELLAYWGESLRADVLLAGHHGSRSSNSRLWLRSIDPDLLVVTAARANRFGHPAAEVLRGAAEHGITVVNTGYSGAVDVQVHPDGRLSCRRLRHRLQAFWRRGSGPADCLHP